MIKVFVLIVFLPNGTIVEKVDYQSWANCEAKRIEKQEAGLMARCFDVDRQQPVTPQQ